MLAALENLGVNISALVAGLGIGGVAVALAGQSILADLFASIAITLDKPFAIGDFISVDDFQDPSNMWDSRPLWFAASTASRS